MYFFYKYFVPMQMKNMNENQFINHFVPNLKVNHDCFSYYYNEKSF